MRVPSKLIARGLETCEIAELQYIFARYIFIQRHCANNSSLSAISAQADRRDNRIYEDDPGALSRAQRRREKGIFNDKRSCSHIQRSFKFAVHTILLARYVDGVITPCVSDKVSSTFQGVPGLDGMKVSDPRGDPVSTLCRFSPPYTWYTRFISLLIAIISVTRSRSIRNIIVGIRSSREMSARLFLFGV